MPKHGFRVPAEVAAAVRAHVRQAIAGVNPARYRQEASYTVALLNRLEGTAYEGVHGSVVFTSTVFDDRGPNSAESIFGADHAITATISRGEQIVNKVILVQAKRGLLEDMTNSETNFLKGQIRKMQGLVPAPKVMQIPETQSPLRRLPQMVSGNNVLNDLPYRPMDLEDYFVTRVITTLDGCTDPIVVEAVQDSTLSQIRVSAKLK